MKKIVIFFIFLIGTGMLVGCKTNKDALKNAIDKSNALNSYELTIELVGSEDGEQQLNTKIDVLINCEAKTGIVTEGYRKNYIYSDYIYDESYDRLSDFKWDELSDPANNGGISITELDISEKKATSEKLSDNKTCYTISVDSVNAVAAMKDKIFEDVVFTNYILDITVDNKTGYWTTFKVSTDFIAEDYYGQHNCHMEITLTLTPKENDYEVLIPLTIKNSMIINAYRTYEKPYSYLFNYRVDGFPAVITEPVPAETHYSNNDYTTYHNIGAFKKIVFDQKTNVLAAMSKDSVRFFDANTFTEMIALNFANVSDISADNGLLVICSGARGILDVYDIVSKSRIAGFMTGTDYYYDEQPFIASIDGDYIVWSDEDQWCAISIWNYKTNTTKKVEMVYRLSEPEIVLDKANHRLYVIETGSSSCDAYTFDSQTGKQVAYNPLNSSFEPRTAFFDGEYFHVAHVSFDADLNIAASGHLTYKYGTLSGFTPAFTILNDGDISIVRGFTGTVNQIAVYDKAIDKYIMLEKGYATRAVKLAYGKYLLSDSKSSFCAVIDVSGKTPLAGNTEGESIGVSVSSLGKLTKTELSTNYNEGIVCGDHIYLLRANAKAVEILNKKTMQSVKTLKYTLVPVSLDAHEGRLVVGMGYGNQLYIYNINDWSYTVVSSTVPVFKTVIYKDMVYFCDNNQHVELYSYNITISEKKVILRMYAPLLAVDKYTGSLYAAENGGSGNELFKIDAGVAVKLVETDYISTALRFDGTYIYAYGVMFNVKTSLALAAEQYVPLFPETSYTKIDGVTYFDNTISVFIVNKDNKEYTVIYNTVKKKLLAELEGNYYSVASDGSDLYMFGNNKGIIYKYAI